MSKDLTAQDIKRIRRKYGLTQQGFARLLGLGEASVVRYENGQTPSKANANLIRAADNPAFIVVPSRSRQAAGMPAPFVVVARGRFDGVRLLRPHQNDGCRHDLHPG